MQVEDLDGRVLRIGSDPGKDTPRGVWRDADGTRWEHLAIKSRNALSERPLSVARAPSPLTTRKEFRTKNMPAPKRSSRTTKIFGFCRNFRFRTSRIER